MIYRFDRPDEALRVADALTAGYQTELGRTPVKISYYDSGAALIGTKQEKSGLFTTVGIGQVGDVTTVLVADQPPPARFDTLDQLLDQERSAL